MDSSSCSIEVNISQDVEYIPVSLRVSSSSSSWRRGVVEAGSFVLMGNIWEFARSDGLIAHLDALGLPEHHALRRRDGKFGDLGRLVVLGPRCLAARGLDR